MLVGCLIEPLTASAREKLQMTCLNTVYRAWICRSLLTWQRQAGGSCICRLLCSFIWHRLCIEVAVSALEQEAQGNTF